MFLKELEDYPWFPSSLRKMQLEYVGWISVQLKLYRPVLKEMIKFRSTQWTDLASGSGWPACYLQKNASHHIHYRLSDLYPDSVSNEVKKHVKAPTLDQLLDKIKNEGVESLTAFEKGTLDNYSKN